MKNILYLGEEILISGSILESIKQKIPFAYISVISCIGQLDKSVIVPDLLIIDVKDALICIDDIRKIRNRFSSKIYIMCICREVKSNYIKSLLNAGANAILHWFISAEEILLCIDKILQGKNFFEDSIKEIILENLIDKFGNYEFRSLSVREQEISRLLINGYRQKEISMELGLAQSTIASFKAKIFEKFRIKSVLELKEVLNNQISWVSNS